jgi:hypothetical protein
MQTVAIVKGQRDINGSWMKVVNALGEVGLKVHLEPVKANRYIVLGGRFENPLAFKGHRTLVYHETEWKPAGYGWEHLFEPLLKEYYDEMVNCTKLSIGEIVAEVRRCWETANS